MYLSGQEVGGQITASGQTAGPHNFFLLQHYEEMGKPSFVTHAHLTDILTAVFKVGSEHPCQPAEPKICIKKDYT